MSAKFIDEQAVGDMKRRMIGVLIFLVLMMLTVGCHQLTAPQQSEKMNADHPQAVRIVSLTLSADEILLSSVSPERIIGVTYLADDPGVCNVVEQAKAIPNKLKANAEAVIALHPDLVIMATWQGDALANTLRDAGLRVYVYDAPNTVADVKTLILSMTKVTGDEQAGQDLVQKMDAELAEVQKRVADVPESARPVVLWHTLNGMTGGVGTLFDDMTHYAGVVNGAAKLGLKSNDTLPKEAILKVDPDMIMLPTWDWQGRGNIDDIRAQLVSDPALAGVKAIRNQRLVQIPEKYMYSSSHQLVKGVQALAAAAYPDRF